MQRGDIVGHFDVRTTSADRFSYSSIWQRKNLVIITLSATATDDEVYLRELNRHEADFSEHDSVCVVTREDLPGLPAPAALIADQWGEIVHVVAALDVNDLPTPHELLEWVAYVASRCPECEGEAR
jgi:hypothetical protein